MRTMASNAGRLAAVAGVADLIEYAHSLRFDDAEGAVTAARRAVGYASGGRRSPEACDLRSRAWGVLGNSLRIAGNLGAAGQALEVSERWRLMGSLSSGLEIESLQFGASLAIAGRRLDDATIMLRRAEDVACDLGDGREISRARIKRAIVATYEGKPAEAAEIILQAIASGDWTLDLRRCALEVLMFAYALGGEPRKALDVWLVSAAIYEGCGDLMRLKLRWVRGLIAAQMLGRTGELEALQREYAARSQPYNAALVGLDLAIYAAQSGDSETARAFLDEAEPILKACGVPADAGPCSTDSLRALRLALAAAGDDG